MAVRTPLFGCEHDILKSLLLGKVDFLVHFPSKGLGDPFDPRVSLRSFQDHFDRFKRVEVTLDSLPHKGGYPELLVLLTTYLLLSLEQVAANLPLYLSPSESDSVEDDFGVELEEEGEEWCLRPFFDLLFFGFLVAGRLRLRLQALV